MGEERVFFNVCNINLIYLYEIPCISFSVSFFRERSGYRYEETATTRNKIIDKKIINNKIISLCSYNCSA